jgi:hypothetical protein
MIPIVGYDFCKSFTAVHSPDGSQTDYQMKLTIIRGDGVSSAGTLYLDSKSTNWPNDIRFTKVDGVSLLSFWREESDATDGTWWIEVDSIPDPADFTGYVHVGDADATDASDIVNTFIFGDHFTGTLTDNWEGDTGDCSVASSILTVVGSGGGWKNIRSKSTFSGDIALRAKAMLTWSTSETMGLLALIDNYISSYVNTVMAYTHVTFPNYSSWICANPTGSTSIGNNGCVNDYHIFDYIRLISGTDTVKMYLDSLQVGSDTTIKVPIVDLYALIGSLRPSNYLDWVVIRKCTYNEPTFGAWGDWEGSASYPTVTTQEATNYTKNTCLANGNITDTGGENATRRGFCYIAGLSGTPTITDSIAYDDGDFGTGAYTKTITGLKPGFNYRIRAYATNSQEQVMVQQFRC